MELVEAQDAVTVFLRELCKFHVTFILDNILFSVCIVLTILIGLILST